MRFAEFGVRSAEWLKSDAGSREGGRGTEGKREEGRASIIPRPLLISALAIGAGLVRAAPVCRRSGGSLRRGTAMSGSTRGLGLVRFVRGGSLRSGRFRFPLRPAALRVRGRAGPVRCQ